MGKSIVRGTHPGKAAAARIVPIIDAIKRRARTPIPAMTILARAE